MGRCTIAQTKMTPDTSVVRKPGKPEAQHPSALEYTYCPPVMASLILHSTQCCAAENIPLPGGTRDMLSLFSFDTFKVSHANRFKMAE